MTIEPTIKGSSNSERKAGIEDGGGIWGMEVRRGQEGMRRSKSCGDIEGNRQWKNIWTQLVETYYDQKISKNEGPLRFENLAATVEFVMHDRYKEDPGYQARVMLGLKEVTCAAGYGNRPKSMFEFDEYSRTRACFDHFSDWVRDDVVSREYSMRVAMGLGYITYTEAKYLISMGDQYDKRVTNYWGEFDPFKLMTADASIGTSWMKNPAIERLTDMGLNGRDWCMLLEFHSKEIREFGIVRREIDPEILKAFYSFELSEEDEYLFLSQLIKHKGIKYLYESQIGKLFLFQQSWNKNETHWLEVLKKHLLVEKDQKLWTEKFGDTVWNLGMLKKIWPKDYYFEYKGELGMLWMDWYVTGWKKEVAEGILEKLKAWPVEISKYRLEAPLEGVLAVGLRNLSRYRNDDVLGKEVMERIAGEDERWIPFEKYFYGKAGGEYDYEEGRRDIYELLMACVKAKHMEGIVVLTRLRQSGESPYFHHLALEKILLGETRKMVREDKTMSIEAIERELKYWRNAGAIFSRKMLNIWEEKLLNVKSELEVEEAVLDIDRLKNIWPGLKEYMEGEAGVDKLNFVKRFDTRDWQILKVLIELPMTKQLFEEGNTVREGNDKLWKEARYNILWRVFKLADEGAQGQELVALWQRTMGGNVVEEESSPDEKRRAETRRQYAAMGMTRSMLGRWWPVL